MKYSIIAAKNNKNTIGLNGQMPWYQKADMEWFKEHTIGKSVIMGRKTWESLPEKFRPLPDRVNIIVSTTLPLPSKPTHHVFKTVKEATKFAETLIRKRGVKVKPEIMYIGGQTIYEQVLDMGICSRLYITQVDNDVDGDTFFPDVDYSKFEKIHHDKDSEYGVEFFIYEKSAK